MAIENPPFDSMFFPARNKHGVRVGDLPGLITRSALQATSIACQVNLEVEVGFFPRDAEERRI